MAALLARTYIKKLFRFFVLRRALDTKIDMGAYGTWCAADEVAPYRAYTIEISGTAPQPGDVRPGRSSPPGELYRRSKDNTTA